MFKKLAEKILISRLVKKYDQQLLNVVESRDEKLILYIGEIYETDDHNYFQINIDIINNGKLVELKNKICMRCFLENKSIWIGKIEIFDKHINKGYGTVLVKELIQWAKVNGFETIAGHMSMGDSDNHYNRLKHFYSKLGFTLHEDNNFNLDLN